MTRERHAGAFVAGLCAIGCATSHPASIAGIGSSTRLNGLSADEWSAFCGWIEGRRGAAPLVYVCSGAEIVAESCEPGFGHCYDWSADGCFGSPGDLRDYYSARLCAPTVGEYAACIDSLLALGSCHRAYFASGETTRECSSFTCAAPDAGSADAGAPDRP